MTQNKHPMYKRLKKHLSVSPKQFLKVWKLHPVLRTISWSVIALFVATILYLWKTCPECKPLEGLLGYLSAKLTLNGIMMALVGLVVAYLLMALLGSRKGKRLLAVFKFRDTFRRIVMSLVASPLVAIFAFVHLHVFDRLFKRIGKVK